MNGTASNYIAGGLGIGTTSFAGSPLAMNWTSTGATAINAVSANIIAQSDVTGRLSIFSSIVGTVASSFTLGLLQHFRAQQGTFGAGSTVTEQVGFGVNANMIGASSNYGFRGDIPLGTNRWNLYMNGTANNYLAGSLLIGTTTDAGYKLDVATGGINGIAEVARFSSIGNGGSNRGVGIIISAPGSANTVSVARLVGYQESTSTTANNASFAIQVANSSGALTEYLRINNVGAVGLGTTNLSTVSLRVSKNIMGSSSAQGIINDGIIQSGVTSNVTYYNSSASTVAATFTLPNLYHYTAVQGTFGAGSIVTNQYGFLVDASLIGATNNYGFYGNIASGTNRWNLYMAGTADNYLAGSVGIGTGSLNNSNLRIALNITGATDVSSVSQVGVVQSGVTTTARGFTNSLSTQASVFTLGTYYHFISQQVTIGAGSTVTNQNAFTADSTLIGATNNYGFRGLIPSGTNRWNIYMDGTANNYIAGALGIGTTSFNNGNLRVGRALSGGVTVSSIAQLGSVQSDVTSSARGFTNSLITSASSFTLTDYIHYIGQLGSLGSGSAITNQYVFYADSSITSATNNYGFYGNIGSGTGRWNLYMNGTANNYLAGALSIGVTTANDSALLQVDSTTKGFLPPRMTAAQRAAIASPAEGLVVFQTDGTVGLYLYASAAWHAMTML
jgi:hypothetical protein